MNFNIYKNQQFVSTIEAPEIYTAIALAENKYGSSFDVEGDGLRAKVEEHMTSFAAFHPVNLDLTQENDSDISIDINIDTDESILRLGRFRIKLNDTQTQKLFEVFYNDRKPE